MKRDTIFYFIFLLLILAILVMLLPRAVGASDGIPEGVSLFEAWGERFVLYDGDNDDILLQVCSCGQDSCESERQPTLTSIDSPEPTAEKPAPSETPKPPDEPVDTPEPTKTEKPKPTVTLVPTPQQCKIWLCHKPGTPAEQNYCCWDSEGCKNAHLKHRDYLGECE